MSTLVALSGRRRRTDVFARGLVTAATVIALVPLVLVIYYVIDHGLITIPKLRQ